MTPEGKAEGVGLVNIKLVIIGFLTILGGFIDFIELQRGLADYETFWGGLVMSFPLNYAAPYRLLIISNHLLLAPMFIGFIVVVSSAWKLHKT
jgi:uncharacterized membrane protein